MNQKDKLRNLLREVPGKSAGELAEYLLANGVRVVEMPEKYNYSDCPNMTKDGCGCTVLTNMVCRNPFRTLPCGFYPPEQRRRADIMELTGENKFHSLVK